VLVRLLVALLLPLMGFNATTTVVSFDACTYGGPQLARVEVDATTASVGALSQFSLSMAGGGERSLVTLGSSTTSSRTFIATNTVNGARLNARLTAEEIAGGHSYEKHVVSQGEFPGIRTRGQFADMIENVINNYDEMKCLSGGRIAYWRDGVVVIRNPSAVDGGTAFVPRDGYTYFEGL
jgi:hypothetical protein